MPASLPRLQRSFSSDSTAAGSTPVRASPVRSDSGIIRYDNFRRHYDLGADERWHESVVERLVEFTRLENDWDGYGAPLSNGMPECSHLLYSPR